MTNSIPALVHDVNRTEQVENNKAPNSNLLTIFDTWQLTNIKHTVHNIYLELLEQISSQQEEIEDLKESIVLLQKQMEDLQN